MTSRREILKVLGAATLAHPLAGLAQQPQKVRRIGWLSQGVRPSAGTQVPSKRLTESLQQLGYEVGRNLLIEWRYAENNPERLPALADELVRLNVELIVTNANQETFAAKRATRSIPIVMAGSTLTVENGFIDSHARPAGNVTGLDWWVPELAEKIYQLLKEVVPGATRAARLWDPKNNLAHLFGDEHLRKITSDTGLTVVSAGITRAEDLAGALDLIVASRAEVLFVAGVASISPLFGKVAAFAEKQKLVAIATHPGYPAVGGLLAYGADNPAHIARLPSYIDRILRGAKPADLPVEFPTKFELVLNKKTAKAIGVTLPPSFMLRVDRTIE